MYVNTISRNDLHQVSRSFSRAWSWPDRLGTRSAEVVQARVMSESSETLLNASWDWSPKPAS